jgi:hypothetical protein
MLPIDKIVGTDIGREKNSLQRKFKHPSRSIPKSKNQKQLPAKLKRSSLTLYNTTETTEKKGRGLHNVRRSFRVSYFLVLSGIPLQLFFSMALGA